MSNNNPTSVLLETLTSDMYNMILCFRHPCPSISSVKQANIWRDMTYWWCQYSAGLDMGQPHLTYIVPVRASRYTLITQHNNTYHHQHCSLKIKIAWQGQIKMNKKFTEANLKNMPLNQIRCYDHVCSETRFLFCWIFQFAANFKLYASFQGSVWFPGRYFPGNSISVAALFRQILWTWGAGEGAGAVGWYHQREKCIEKRSQLVSHRIAAAAVIPIQNEVANKIFLIFQVTI